jgi:hypothetical protein
LNFVIILLGISGTVLSKDGKGAWGTSTAAIWQAVTGGGESIRSLSIKGADDPSLEDLGDGVKATGLAGSPHYSGTVEDRRLHRAGEAAEVIELKLEDGRNLFEFAYDWRRDNRVAARKLAQAAKGWLDRWRTTSGASDAKLVLVAHSMGGLVSQYFLEVMARGRTRARSSPSGRPTAARSTRSATSPTASRKASAR